MPSTFHIHKEEKYGYVDKKLCENEMFDIVLQPMDDKTAKINNKKNLFQATKVHKCLATAHVEVRSFRKIRFSRLNLSLSDG